MCNSYYAFATTAAHICASCKEPVEGGDCAGCAQALLEHGAPRATRDIEDPDWVLIDGRKKRFSDEVTDVLLGLSDVA